MPLGPFKDFDACVRTQISKGKSKESAQKICGALQKKIEGKEDTEVPERRFNIPFHDVEMTRDKVSEYGLDFDAINKQNLKLIEGELMLLNEPCVPMQVGQDESDSTCFIFTENAAKKALETIKNKPIHVTADMDGHFMIDPISGERKYISVGTHLGAKIDDSDHGKVVKILGGLWEEDYPNEVKEISERIEELGMSFELIPNSESFEEIDENTVKVNEFEYKGSAILNKADAAFPQTSLLVAQKGNGKKKEESNDINDVKSELNLVKDTINLTRTHLTKKIDEMFSQVKKNTETLNNNKKGGNQLMAGEVKTYTQEEVDQMLSTAKKEAKEVSDATLEAFKKDSETGKILEEKESKLAELQGKVDSVTKEKDEALKKVAEAQTSEKLKDAEIKAQVWFEKNKEKMTIEENDEKAAKEILGARIKMELNQASKEDHDRILSAFMKESTDLIGGDGSGSGTEKKLTEEELAKKYDIKLTSVSK